MTTPEASKALADKIAQTISSGLATGVGSIAIADCVMNDITAHKRAQPGTPFVCPKCGTRGTTDGCTSTIEGSKR
jgi:hypothetical protein